jgi:hypothetical protein
VEVKISFFFIKVVEVPNIEDRVHSLLCGKALHVYLNSFLWGFRNPQFVSPNGPSVFSDRQLDYQYFLRFYDSLIIRRPVRVFFTLSVLHANSPKTATQCYLCSKSKSSWELNNVISIYFFNRYLKRPTIILYMHFSTTHLCRNQFTPILKWDNPKEHTQLLTKFYYYNLL